MGREVKCSDRHMATRVENENPTADVGAEKTTSAADTTPAVDRQKTTPLLLRLYVKVGGQFRQDDFSQRHMSEIAEHEVQIYTWKDATLKELADTVKEVEPAARKSRISFQLVYPDRNGVNVMKFMGCVQPFRRNPSVDDVKLEDAKFQTGDFIALGVLPNDGRHKDDFESGARDGGDRRRGGGRGRGGRHGGYGDRDRDFDRQRDRHGERERGGRR
eukprot:GFYU01000153.1.p1 GENE.GFYU01000153.1~~GFYU01000153.1.p1  ORF type:complete len:217 (-),score=41.94 GFYU01000153.1:153-803(-)